MTFGNMNMKRYTTILLCSILAAALLTSCQTFQIEDSTAKEAFGDLGGTLVVIDCSSGQSTIYQPDVAKIPLPPCSTFKIVNAVIGLETGILSSPEEPFYRWDGVERSIPAWNHDLTCRAGEINAAHRLRRSAVLEGIACGAKEAHVHQED